MTDEAELLQRLRNREKNSIDEAIRIYTPYLLSLIHILVDYRKENR